MMSQKVCRFFQQGYCKHGDACRFVHNVPCDNDRKIKNEMKKRRPKNRRVKNTECFTPCHDVPDMRVVVSLCPPLTISPYDVMLVPSFSFSDSTYDLLLKEIKNDAVWKRWHGDSHLIADDHLQWKKHCPTFLSVIDAISSFFKMDVKATRLNWYKDGSDWKPFHFDSAAVKPEKAKEQNLTVGVSFGATRSISFEHDHKRDGMMNPVKTTIEFPLPNGMVYSFSNEVNCTFKHGVPQQRPLEDGSFPDDGRISVIAWGWSDLIQ